jgi:hypothetical protein
LKFSWYNKKLGFGEDKQVKGAMEYDKAKEKAGYIAGKHIQRKEDWWFLRSKKAWYEESASSSAKRDSNDGKK